MSTFLSIFRQPCINNYIFRLNMSTKKSFKPKGKFVIPTKKPKFVFPAIHEKRIASVLRNPVKSESDKKEYRVIKLTNGLTALLISDLASLKIKDSLEQDLSSSESDVSSSEECESDRSIESVDGEDTRTGHKDISDNEEKMAACALSVNVGSYSDPHEIQGLAHFLEHMVFMGSSKYPKENDFDSFIKKKGGSDNASTDAELTTFLFEVQEKHLAEAMDRFCQFFVSPLMHKESLQRERESVESEFAMALPSDVHRKDQLLASTFAANHPAKTFSWGNMKSLKDLISSDDDLHVRLHEFRKRHYSAHRMMIAVQARLSLNDLERYVVATFGSIPSNNQPVDDFSKYNYTPQILSPDFHGMFFVKPVKEVCEVNLTWCMRSFLKEYESKPHQYVSFIIGHEGKYSLLSYLRKKVWALGIYTGNSESGTDHTSMYCLLTITLILTQDGIKNLEEVLTTVFSFLNMLRNLGPNERIYDEIKKISDINFRFEDESQPYENVESLVEDMHIYPPEHYLSGSELYFKYDPEAIQYVMDSMTPDNVNIMVLSNKYVTPVEYDQKEMWFGTEYSRIDIPETLKERCRNVPPLDCFKLPEPNIYVSENFDLIPMPQSDNKNCPKAPCREMSMESDTTDILISGPCDDKDYPILLRKDDLMELWYKADYKFKLPNAYIYIYMISPISTRCPKDSVILDIWCELLKQHLVEIVYPAEMAGLTHSIYMSDKGLTVKLNGYNEKIHLLVDSITKAMREFQETVTPELFEAIKSILAKSYHNAIIKPSKLVREVRLALLMEKFWTSIDKIEVLKSITLQDVHHTGKEFLETLYVQMLVQGNIMSSYAVNIAAKVHQNIQWSPLSEASFPDLKVNKINLGENKCRMLSFNNSDPNTLVTNYYQSGLSNIKDSCIVEVIIMLMEEPLFDTLRTKEQLGYNVFCLMRYTFGVLGYSVTVNTQADKFSAEYVDTRIEAFLKYFAKKIKKLSEKSFQQSKITLIKLKQSVDIELKEEVTRNWAEITSMEYNFDRLPKEVECIKTLKHAEIKKWFDSHSAYGVRDNFKKLTVQIVGHGVSQNSNTMDDNNESLALHYPIKYLAGDIVANGDNELTASSFITDIKVYRSALDVFPNLSKTLKICRCKNVC